MKTTKIEVLDWPAMIFIISYFTFSLINSKYISENKIKIEMFYIRMKTGSQAFSAQLLLFLNKLFTMLNIQQQNRAKTKTAPAEGDRKEPDFRIVTKNCLLQKSRFLFICPMFISLNFKDFKYFFKVMFIVPILFLTLETLILAYGFHLIETEAGKSFPWNFHLLD